MKSSMQLIIESDNLQDFLEATDVVNFHDPLIAKLIADIKSSSSGQEERAEKAFNFARDQVRHSFDADDLVVTIKAPEVLTAGTGICFAKSHLLAALLRGLEIPTGFCYQRVMRRGTPESGFALHGLNASYFPGVGWVRLDPRGNRPGIDSRFSLQEEHLAYSINSQAGEVDYPYVYRQPLSPVIQSMQDSKDCHELFYQRPPRIEEGSMLNPPLR